MPPLSLDSDRWAQLTHAYGPAIDTPVLLRRLYESPDDEVWSDLCGSVIHQGDVSEAAYAAVPHVMAAAESASKSDRVMHLAFAASVLDGRERKPCPDDLRAEFEQTTRNARDMAAEVLASGEVQESDLPYVYETIVAANGLPILARIIEQFSNDEFTFVCAGCESWLYVSTDGLPFHVYAEDPVSHPDSRSAIVTPAEDPEIDGRVPSSGATALAWLRSLSDTQATHLFEDKLGSLYGSSECPRCGHAFNLFGELEKAEAEAEETFANR